MSVQLRVRAGSGRPVDPDYTSYRWIGTCELERSLDGAYVAHAALVSLDTGEMFALWWDRYQDPPRFQLMPIRRTDAMPAL